MVTTTHEIRLDTYAKVKLSVEVDADSNSRIDLLDGVDYTSGEGWITVAWRARGEAPYGYTLHYLRLTLSMQGTKQSDYDHDYLLGLLVRDFVGPTYEELTADTETPPQGLVSVTTAWLDNVFDREHGYYVAGNPEMFMSKAQVRRRTWTRADISACSRSQRYAINLANAQAASCDIEGRGI